MSIPQQAFTFRSTVSPSWPAGKDENDRLCDECAKLNLEESFANAFALYEGARRGRYIRKMAVYRSDIGLAYLGHFYYVTSLGNRLSRATLCKLCNFLKQICLDPSKGTYKLLAICTSESYLFEIPKKPKRGRPERRPWGEVEHNVFMALVPEVPLMPKTGVPVRWFENELPKIGSIYRLSRRTPDERMRLALPRNVRPRADIGLGRVWLDCCRRAHKFCAPKKLAGAALPGFRAINCAKTPMVVEDRPWSENYVALSYVWGPPSGDWSKTILDAVEVTKQLGEQYLWVDRLCINQSNLQEKQSLVSKMDAIYEGAEFTIVAAAGDARTGLPGVTTKSRKLQPLVELKGRNRTTSPALANNSAASTPDPYIKLVGITTEEFEETCKDREWLDLHRLGLKSNKVVFDSEDMRDLDKEQEIMETYDISHEHLNWFKDFADDHGNSIDEMMPKMKHLAQCRGVPLQELIPSLIGDIATRAGVPAQPVESIARGPPPPITRSSKIEKPLPPGETSGTTILISTLEDPRITIRHSEWATRGWTYQEGVLSNRRLVFTEQQMYWECNGMAKHESLDILGLRDASHTRSADYILSGIFDGDLHRMPELQYGFKASSGDEVSEQVLKLDSHIRAFTSRNLGYDSDSLNAFLGVAARYSTNSGLHLLLGMPVWAGFFATGKPGLQDTFALSVSAWTHAAQRVAEDAEMYVLDCPRRPQFPSWTWVGWKGRVDFSTAGEEEDDLTGWEDAVHVDFFKVMTSSSWASSIGRLWSAEMMLHATDGSEATMLVGHAPVASTATDPSKTWLLTIREPLVLRHMFLMHSTNEGEWRRLMGKRVQLHLSVPITEAELTIGHKSGELVTVLVFASTVPFIWNGVARYLILRRADDAGTRWERIGRLAMTLEEWELDRYKSTVEMIAALPVKEFGRDLVLA